MENYFVYILRSESTGVLYKGFTTCIERRLFEHNNGMTRYSSSHRPWSLVYLEKCDTKREALIIERKLKKCNHKYLETLIHSSRNTI
ncbi:MAG: GIY-YIG nuclease family protein [Flavobacteriales bacterium]